MTEEQIRNISMNGECIPEYMIGGVLRYFNDHGQPGDFLQAILENDFMLACRYADEENSAAFPAWAALLYEAPHTAYGSPEKVKAWLKARGVVK